MSKDELVDLLRRDHPDVARHCRIVGAWVWAEFPNKPSAEDRAVLKTLKFRWNPKRKAWQNSCGVYRKYNRRIDPRLKYGETAISTGRGSALEMDNRPDVAVAASRPIGRHLEMD